MKKDTFTHYIAIKKLSFQFLFLITLVFLLLLQCATRPITTRDDVIRAKAKYQGGHLGYAADLVLVANNENLPLEVRQEALNVLGEIKDPDGLDKIAQSIPDLAQSNLHLAITATKILTETKNQDYALLIATSLTEARLSYLEFRNSLLLALHQLPDEKIILPLIEIMEYSKEDFYAIQSLISEMLGAMNDERVVPVLMHIATDEETDITLRSRVIEILSEKNDPTIADTFAELLGDPSSQLMVRDFALKAIDDVEDEKLILALLESHQRNKTDYQQLLGVLVGALAEFQDARAIPTLLEIVTDKTVPPGLRKKAALNLVQIADRPTMDSLIDLMHDKENYFLFAVIENLVKEKGSEEDLQKLREASWEAQKETLFNLEN